MCFSAKVIQKHEKQHDAWMGAASHLILSRVQGTGLVF